MLLERTADLPHFHFVKTCEILTKLKEIRATRKKIYQKKLEEKEKM